MSIPLIFTRDELLSRLRALIPVAEKADAKALVAHRKDEQAYLDRFHAACRAALKWDYRQASAHDFEAKVIQSEKRGGYRGWKENSPACPRSRVDSLNRCIAIIEASTVREFRLQQHGKYRDIYRELTAHIEPPKGMC